MRINSHHKTLKFVALTALLSFSVLNVAQASIISSDLTIDAKTASDMLPGDISSGDFSLIQSGVTSTSTYSDGVVAVGDDDPLGGSLFNTGDGIGFTGSANISDGETFFAGFDSFMTIENNSSLVYDIILKLVFDNSVTANGDAYAASEFFIDANGLEVFFSDLWADTEGNLIDGVDTDPESFGGTLSESGTVFIPFVLNPADILELELFWTAKGQNFGIDGAAFSFSQFLSIDSAEARSTQPPVDVPEPNIALLFLLTFAGLVVRSTKTKN
jgi:hypothetical protein